MAAKFKVKSNSKGEFRFTLVAGNGEPIAVSESYSSKASCLNGIKSVQTNAPIAALEDQTVAGFATERHPKFELYTDKAGESRFRLKASNGEIIATGESYKQKDGCKKAIESIRKNAPEATVEEVE